VVFLQFLTTGDARHFLLVGLRSEGRTNTALRRGRRKVRPTCISAANSAEKSRRSTKENCNGEQARSKENDAQSKRRKQAI
jgi:hypothetical protein